MKLCSLKKKSKSKINYIGDLLSVAKRRKKNADVVRERKEVYDRNRHNTYPGLTARYITSSYRKTLQENQDCLTIPPATGNTQARVAEKYSSHNKTYCTPPKCKLMTTKQQQNASYTLRASGQKNELKSLTMRPISSSSLPVYIQNANEKVQAAQKRFLLRKKS